MKLLNFLKPNKDRTAVALAPAKYVRNKHKIVEQINDKVPVIEYEYKEVKLHILNEDTAVYHIVHTTPKMEKLAQACSRPESGVVLDVGANIGLFSFFYKVIYPNSRIYLFEPDERLIPIIRKNLSSFQQFEIVQKAVGEENGKIKFYVNPKSSQTNSAMIESLTPFSAEENLLIKEVESINLSDFCSSVGIGQIDVIKIDIQGSEYSTFKSAERILPLTKEALVEVCFLMPNTLQLVNLMSNYYGEYEAINDIIMGADLKFYNTIVGE